MREWTAPARQRLRHRERAMRGPRRARPFTRRPMRAHADDEIRRQRRVAANPSRQISVVPGAAGRVFTLPTAGTDLETAPRAMPRSKSVA